MRKCLHFFLLWWTLSACSRVPNVIPSGFARLMTKSFHETRAVSPDGIVYRAHVVTASQKVGVDFWQAAIKSHLTSSGYKFVAEARFSTSSGWQGAWVETAAPLQNHDVKYLVGFLLRRNDILVVEASGDVLAYEARRNSIMNVFKSL